MNTILSRLSKLLRAVFIDDPGLKAICLMLAVLMWFYIDGELMSQKEFELPMSSSDIARADALELAAPDSLPVFVVRVRGPRRLIELWQHQNLRFKRKLIDNPRAGSNPVTALPGDVYAENFSVVSVAPKNPEGAAVVFISTAVETKPVSVRVRGQPKDGFLIGKPVCNPTHVKIKGAAADLAEIQEVWTEEVDVANADQDVSGEFAVLRSVESGGRKIAFICAEKVHVVVPINPVVVVRQAAFEVWARVPPGLAMTVEPQTVQVELVIEARGIDIQEVQSKIVLFAEWPRNWQRPKDSKTALGPERVALKFSAPPRVQVRGINGAALPEITVTGTLAGELK